MTQATFRMIVAEPSTAIDADWVSRRMTSRPTSRRQNRWKKAWTELSKEAVWLAIVERHALGEQIGNPRHPKRERQQPHRQTGILEPPPAHPAHVLRRQRRVSQPFGLSQRRTEQGTILLLGRDFSRVKIRPGRQRCTVESQGPSAVMTASGDVRLGAQGRWGDRLRGCTITGTRPPERMTRGLPQYDAIVSHDHSIEHVTTHSHIYRDINQILRPQTLPRGRIVLPSPFGENGFPLRVPLLYSGERGRSRPGARPLRTAVGDGSQPRDPARSP